MGHVVSSHRRTGSHLDLRQQPPLVVAVITAGILIGINNTLTTQTAMMVSLPPAERPSPTSSAAPGAPSTTSRRRATTQPPRAELTDPVGTGEWMRSVRWLLARSVRDLPLMSWDRPGHGRPATGSVTGHRSPMFESQSTRCDVSRARCVAAAGPLDRSRHRRRWWRSGARWRTHRLRRRGPPRPPSLPCSATTPMSAAPPGPCRKMVFLPDGLFLVFRGRFLPERTTPAGPFGRCRPHCWPPTVKVSPTPVGKGVL
jgi:hypothetical protein